jgi:hypothetical protein
MSGRYMILISGLKGIQIFKLEIRTSINIITKIGLSNMHIHLNFGTRIMLFSLSILVIHRFFLIRDNAWFICN